MKTARVDATQIALILLVLVVTAGTVLRTVLVVGRESGVKPSATVSAEARALQPPPTRPPDTATLDRMLARDPFQPPPSPRVATPVKRVVVKAPPKPVEPPLPRVVTSDGTHAILSGADGDKMVWAGQSYGAFSVAGIDERQVTLEWKGKRYSLAAPVSR